MFRGKKLNSVTLVELMVAMGITLFIIGASLPLVLRNNKTKVLEDQGKIVGSFIERAKNFAMHPETENGEQAGAYGVSCAGPHRLELKWRDKADPPVIGSVTGESLALPNEFVVSPCDTDKIVFFNLYSGEYVGAAQTFTILRDGTTGPKARVTVQKPGRIDVEVQD